jgi:hypothetical protein
MKAVFVGGLPASVNEDKLIELFKQVRCACGGAGDSPLSRWRWWRLATPRTMCTPCRLLHCCALHTLVCRFCLARQFGEIDKVMLPYSKDDPTK